MLKTSVVDLITPGLVDALLGKRVEGRPATGPARAVRGVRLASRPLTFRYHVMFRELLRSQLRHRMPDAFALQHRKAARWYAQHGRSVMAIRHSIEAKDWDVAAGLVTANWLRLVVGGEARWP